jgi:hypothetical protein
VELKQPSRLRVKPADGQKHEYVQIMEIGSTDTEGVMAVFFGIVPAAALSLASFAMRRVVRS